MTYIAFIRRRALMLSSSHKPGCMAAIPASQSCRVRRVLCMTDAHSSCVQPAVARRACRASGEKAARCLRRFGWLGIRHSPSLNIEAASIFKFQNIKITIDIKLFGDAGIQRVLGLHWRLAEDFVIFCTGHFDSLAPESRGAVVSDFAGMSELYTRIPCVQLPFVGKFEIV